MTPLVFFAVVVTLLFFLVLPIVFSLQALVEYRKIRHAVMRSNATALLTSDTEKTELFRCFGKFDGFKDDNEIWVRTDHALVKVNMNRGKLISLPEKVSTAQSVFWGGKIPGRLKIVRWKKLKTLASGTKLFLFGRFRKEGGIYCLDARERDSIIVLYEGDSNGIDRELVVQTKNRYTYFQSPSRAVLIMGAFLMSLISVWEYRFNGFSFPFFMYLLTAAIPVLFFVPPGCLLLLLSYNLKYRVFVLRRNYYFRYFSRQNEKPNATHYWQKLWLYEITAIFAAIGALVINFILFTFLIYFFVL